MGFAWFAYSSSGDPAYLDCNQARSYSEAACYLSGDVLWLTPHPFGPCLGGTRDKH